MMARKGRCGLHLSKPGIAFLSLVGAFQPRLLLFVSVTEWKLKMANWLGGGVFLKLGYKYELTRVAVGEGRREGRQEGLS